MFNKPFAATKQGAITAEQINKDMMMTLTTERCHGAKPVQQKAQDKFQRTSCLSWKEARDQGLVCNLVGSPAELGRPMSEFGAEHDKLEKGETMLGFRGGFHCRKIEGVR